MSETESDNRGLFERLGESARRCIVAVEIEGGEWLASSSDWPELVGQGPALEDSIVDLFDQAENQAAARAN
jgi:hypothetical protein